MTTVLLKEIINPINRRILNVHKKGPLILEKSTRINASRILYAKMEEFALNP
jgi:hypothetical protein